MQRENPKRVGVLNLPVRLVASAIDPSENVPKLITQFKTFNLEHCFFSPNLFDSVLGFTNTLTLAADLARRSRCQFAKSVTFPLANIVTLSQKNN